MVEMIRDIIMLFFAGMEEWEYYSPIIDLFSIVTFILVFVFIVKVFRWIVNFSRATIFRNRF